MKEKIVVYVRSSGIFDDSRATKEIQAISSLGHKVIVLCWDRYGNAFENNVTTFTNYTNVIFYYYKKIVISGIGMKNIGKLIGWLRWVKKMISTINPTVVHFCDLDSCFLSLKYCLDKKIPYIYDVFDYYTDSHYVPSLFKRIIENREILSINGSYCTIICTEERIKQIAKANPKKIIVLHNSPSLKSEDSFSSETLFDYVYCGSLGDKRLISEILDLYPQNKDLKFFFAGYGPLSERCKELSEKYENFRFEKSIPYNEVLRIESQSRCLSAIYEPSIRNHKLCAPNKFYESLALGKPVIVCFGTGIDQIVKENNLGLSISYDANSFYNSVRLFKKSDDLLSFSKRARTLYLEKYDWDLIMVPRLLNVYREILENV